ncbi:hypothetical protein AA0472_2137 [Acetobacter estunensis NRIC 0472]|uniref:Glycosyltransferase n=1 Tax=Acetobacter estunensis TaxID=104097 RepID=A0A967EJK8_9PROT|nr:glycosyltransferase [Acetobacter estunensis]NHO55374.1 glycosyltransferase [Acetobacter estunensis]GBQ26513.1 hypothetical protein AA0472_2137 [Acetobacter estunensis NRIC 0472]
MAPRRLVWASRLDRQKRPDILRRIALELSSSKDAPDILVYGSSVLDSFDVGFFVECPNVTYMGAFAGLDSIPFTDQDAFLYTSLFDGMPNIILEAIEKKVPIISVNVGGVSELLTEDTAFLVRETADDRDLVLRYVEQIERFMDCSADELRERVERLYGKYSRQHEAQIYDKKVSEIYSVFHKG